MNKRIIVSALLVITTSLSAANWEEYGFKILSSSQENTQGMDDRTTLELSDKDGRALTVQTSGNAADKSIPAVAQLQKTLFGLKSMQIKNIRYSLLENGIVEVQVFPASFSSDGVDFMPNIPGHLFFIYKDQLQYSFRLEVNKLFVKIKGYYTDEAELLKKMKQAIKDPQGFIVKRDPEYFIAKLEKLEEELETQKSKTHRLETEMERMRRITAALHNSGIFSGPEAIPEKLINRVVELKTKNPAWKQEQIQTQLDQEKVEWTKKQIRLILAVYFSELE
ncbi:MAG: hypothetical protein LDLANPLL_01615 [Turneriella sp.]|nr:hypothetical protein [Turneriella sp.]